MDLPDLISKMDWLFVTRLIQRMKAGEYTMEEAQEKSRQFSTLFPFLTNEDLKCKLKDYGDVNKEFVFLYMDYLKIDEDQKKEVVLSKLSQYFKNEVENTIQ